MIPLISDEDNGEMVPGTQMKDPYMLRTQGSAVQQEM